MIGLFNYQADNMLMVLPTCMFNVRMSLSSLLFFSNQTDFSATLSLHHYKVEKELNHLKGCWGCLSVSPSASKHFPIKTNQTHNIRKRQSDSGRPPLHFQMTCLLCVAVISFLLVRTTPKADETDWKRFEWENGLFGWHFFFVKSRKIYFLIWKDWPNHLACKILGYKIEKNWDQSKYLFLTQFFRQNYYFQTIARYSPWNPWGL